MMFRMSVVISALAVLLFGGNAVLSQTVTPAPVQDTGGHHSADDARLDELTKEISELRRLLITLQGQNDQAQIRQMLDKIGEAQGESEHRIRNDIRVLRNMISARR